MNERTAYALLIATPVVTAFGQALMRAGMKSAGIGVPHCTGPILLTAATSPAVLSGLAIYAICTLVWLMLLSHFELSYAYPFLGLSFIVALFLGATMLGELINLTRVLGTLLICIGVALVAAS